MRVPAIVLSGFLGSGKTTLLMRLLEASQIKGLKPAILMNELGKRDVDGIGLTPLGKELDIQKLLDGCVCCSRKHELAGKLKELLLQKPDVIFIELTGVANPEEVALALSDAELLPKLKLHKVVTVLDAENVLEYNSWMDADWNLVRTLRRQIETADLLILNKTDLVKDDKRAKIEKELRKQNAISPIMHAKHSEVDLETIIGGLSPLQSDTAATKRVMRPGLSVSIKKKAEPDVHEHGHAHEHNHQHEHGQNAPSFSRVRTLSLSLPADPCPTPREIEKFLDAQGKKLLRAKGYIYVTRKKKFFLMQLAGTRVTWEPADYYRDEPYLVLIGLDLDEQEVEQEWARRLALC